MTSCKILCPHLIMQRNVKQATLTVNGSLTDFWGISEPSSTTSIQFELSPSVKDQVESQGIPHTAVHVLEINGASKPWSHNLCDGDVISLYPYDNTTKCAPIFLQPERFIADVHLGKLANTLRLLGFDTSFDSDWDDDEIIERSNSEQRMILTRDLGLLKNGASCYGYWIRSTDPDKQITELFNRFELSSSVAPFTRCMKCNGLLTKVEKETVQEKVPPKVQEWHSDYWQCTNCKQVYWQGSHFKDLQQKVDNLLDNTS